MKKGLLFLFCFIWVGVMTPAFAMAGDTYYVDEDGDSGAKGTKDDPFKSISSAIKKDPDTIKVSSGTYSESFTLPKGAELKGSGGVTIKGKITMKDGAEIEDITVKNGGIIVEGDAEIKDVSVKSSGVGIETEGKGTLVVRDVKITGNRKGMYIQAGKNVDIRSSTISDSDEEGIDIRANVDGVISGNKIDHNGESGIEVILGSSQLVISGNSLKSNGSSGIAAQYYKHAKKLGGLNVQSNTVTGNKNFGLDCKLPSGGSPGDTYWTDSVSFAGNAVSGNRIGSFAPKCNFGERKEEFALLTEGEQEQFITKEKKEEAERIAAEEEAARLAEEERLRLLAEAQAREQQRIAQQENFVVRVEEVDTRLVQIEKDISERTRLQEIFSDSRNNDIQALQEQNNAITVLMRDNNDYRNGQKLVQTQQRIAVLLEQNAQRMQRHNPRLWCLTDNTVHSTSLTDVDTSRTTVCVPRIS